MNPLLHSSMMNRLRQNGSVLTGLMALLLFLGSISVQAQTINTWTGSTDTDWHTTTNWSLTLVPTTTHNVMIPGSLTNYPILSSAASASTVEVVSGASLTITSAGSLSVNGSKSGTNGTARFRNRGTVVNAGQVLLGNSPSATAAQLGLWNAGTFTHTSGLMTIDRADVYGLYNLTASGSFVNSGTLAVGAVSDVGQYGLTNDGGATFSNTTGGYITLDRATNRALWNTTASSSFVNSATIMIGSIAEVNQGIWNFGSFRNLADGFIAIDRTTDVGLSNSSTDTGFINSGTITIGASATIGSDGLSNKGSFTNTAGGSITINRTRFAGLYNGIASSVPRVLASLVNSGTITIGTSLTRAIENDGIFHNQGGGCINPAPGLINSLGNGIITNTSSFSNTGTIIERATGNSGISFNGGVIQNLNGGSFTVASGSLTPTVTLTVTSNADSGPNTLRQAMLDVMATTCPGPFTITVTASGIINLASALPTISKSIVFLGPGAASLTVRRNTGGDYRLFNISANQTVSFDGFTLADGNVTGAQGGAIYGSSSSSLTVSNCVFNTNRASTDGGAIYSESSQLVLSNCRFTGNMAGGYGGALESLSPNPVITNCFFTNNTGSVGGAVDFYGSSPNITNCAFMGNSAGGGNGGAIATLGGTATVTNSSFRNNTGGSGQAQAIKNESSSFSLNNSILFGNGVGQPIMNTGSSTVVAAYSLFEPSATGYTNGGNNRTATLSPFASATGVGLNACSPAIDAGNPASTTVANPPYSATNLPALDLTGNARIVAGIVDMGAEEYAGPGSFTTTLTAGPSSTLTCTRTSLTLTATGGASYTFVGPGLSQSGVMATAVVSQSGVFSVTATDATGCPSVASTTVYSNTVTPTAGLVVSGTITCAVPAVTLTASGGAGIPGGTGATHAYTFSGPSIVSTAGNLATVNLGGIYSVTVLNPANGCFATNTVSVSIDLGGAPPAPILSASLSVVCAGANVMVVGTIVGSPPGLQWYKDGQPTGQTTATLTLGGVQAAQAGSYVLTIPGACSVSSAPFVLTVNPLPTVTILVPQGSMVNGPGTGVATITLPAPLTGVAMQALGGTQYERFILLDRINGFEIRQVDQNANGIFTVNRTGPFSLTVTDGNGCKRTVEGTVLTR